MNSILIKYPPPDTPLKPNQPFFPSNKSRGDLLALFLRFEGLEYVYLDDYSSIIKFTNEAYCNMAKEMLEKLELFDIHYQEVPKRLNSEVPSPPPFNEELKEEIGLKVKRLPKWSSSEIETLFVSLGEYLEIPQSEFTLKTSFEEDREAFIIFKQIPTSQKMISFLHQYTNLECHYMMSYKADMIQDMSEVSSFGFEPAFPSPPDPISPVSENAWSATDEKVDRKWGSGSVASYSQTEKRVSMTEDRFPAITAENSTTTATAAYNNRPGTRNEVDQLKHRILVLEGQLGIEKKMNQTLQQHVTELIDMNALLKRDLEMFVLGR